ncbi:uncharacterized protein LOC132721147 [Ruditapes philippinarum]|uniref:uncharacterized protein LOC132721147 n=1 Tax=Ruditapes philippinarum TaxID=129788 RepID=UPI00295B0F75|nr:uncharacterized protein LOC132721147 [Ruditapes philippinarum]
MNLREWTSNSAKLNELIPEEDKTDSSITKVLGLTWDTMVDTLSLNVSFASIDSQSPTKRIILKNIASVFDPLGLLCPVLLKGKVLLQSIWKERLDLDDQIKDFKTLDTWSFVKEDLEKITSFKFPRTIAMKKFEHNTENVLVCFCDASAKAYATAVYLLQRNETETTVHLVFAKSRLAPLKEITIPRLELMAVLIGVRSVKFACNQLKLNLKHVYVWTD